MRLGTPVGKTVRAHSTDRSWAEAVTCPADRACRTGPATAINCVTSSTRLPSLARVGRRARRSTAMHLGLSSTACTTASASEEPMQRSTLAPVLSLVAVRRGARHTGRLRSIDHELAAVPGPDGSTSAPPPTTCGTACQPSVGCGGGLACLGRGRWIRVQARLVPQMSDRGVLRVRPRLQDRPGLHERRVRLCSGGRLRSMLEEQHLLFHPARLQPGSRVREPGPVHRCLQRLDLPERLHGQRRILGDQRVRHRLFVSGITVPCLLPRLGRGSGC